MATQMNHSSIASPQKLHPEIVKKIIEDILKEKLSQKTYDAQQAPDWLATAVQTILQKLLDKGPKFKIVVHGIILQRVGAGLHTTSTCFWDPTDGNFCSL